MEFPSLGALPDDCLARVLSLCTPRDVARLALVCKAWAAASASADVAWRRRLPAASKVDDCFPFLLGASDSATSRSCNQQPSSSGSSCSSRSPGSDVKVESDSRSIGSSSRVWSRLRQLCSSSGVRSRDDKYVLMLHPQTGAVRVHVSVVANFWVCGLDQENPTGYFSSNSGVDGSLFPSCAYLITICWFQIRGRFRLPFLLPAGRYSVAWRVAKRPGWFKWTERLPTCTINRPGEEEEPLIKDAKVDVVGSASTRRGPPSESFVERWGDVGGGNVCERRLPRRKSGAGGFLRRIFRRRVPSTAPPIARSPSSSPFEEEGEGDDDEGEHDSDFDVDDGLNHYGWKERGGLMRARGQGSARLEWVEAEVGTITLEPSGPDTDSRCGGLAEVDLEVDLREIVTGWWKDGLFVDSLVLTQVDVW